MKLKISWVCSTVLPFTYARKLMDSLPINEEVPNRSGGETLDEIGDFPEIAFDEPVWCT